MPPPPIERERLEWQVEELAALGFTAARWDEMQAEHARLSHAASLLEGAQYWSGGPGGERRGLSRPAHGVIARLDTIWSSTTPA